MDFFKSVFSAEPGSPDPSSDSQTPSNEKEIEEEEKEEEAVSEEYNGGGGGGAWNFGGLMKTIASRSESVIQTYRRDLEEFSSGLKKETSVFKEVASRAVLDLPGSLETGASVAQESLESVGQAIDDFGGSVWRGTAEIISQGKEALLSADSDSNSQDLDMMQGSASMKRYSRFEIQVLALQNDASTFVEEAEDGEEFDRWREGFELEEREEEIEGLLYENGTLEGFFDKLVPEVVDRETFWSRYFYRVYRLKQAEDARAKLVKRVIAGDEEEELSWEVDDDDDDDNDDNREEVGEKVKEEQKDGEKKATEEKNIGTLETMEETPTEIASSKVQIVETSEDSRENVETSEKASVEVVKKEAVEITEPVEENRPIEASQAENMEASEKVKSSGDDGAPLKMDDKMASLSKSEPGESGKDSDFSVISSQPSTQEEDDQDWDEIEDLGEHEDKKVGESSGNPEKVDLLKRLSAAEDDEDLSWDIEDDDDAPTKP